ncbi:MAG TPA: Flp family type IVb pilin [Rhizomicrobium sp.]|nr:Flp family type IVb pilin [Rhizomicrobium sp.]
MNTIINRFIHDESGATAIEYGLIAGLISVAIIGAITTLGGNLSTLFNTIAGKLSAANTTAGK